jgi:DNA-binding SARP family transcriptional activator
MRQVGVLGGLGVRPAHRLPGVGRRVLAYLAVRGPVVMRTLMSMELWPDLSESRGRANLRRALWQLPPGWVSANGGDLRLEAEVDLDQAREAVAQAVATGQLRDGQLDLLTRDLLPGWYDEWLVADQDQFHLSRIQALEAVSRAACAAGDHALATRSGLAAVCAEPLRESSVTVLVEAHLGERNLFEAVRRYESYAALLGREMDAEPGPQLAALLPAYLESHALAATGSARTGGSNGRPRGH